MTAATRFAVNVIRVASNAKRACSAWADKDLWFYD